MKQTGSAADSQKQHFVPEAYLREFTPDRNGFFYQLNFANPRLQIRRVYVSNVCYVRNFYDINNDQELNSLGINNPRYLEASFYYENAFTKILGRIRERQSYLSRKEFELLVEAYIGIKHRGPMYRKEIARLQQEGIVFDQIADNLKTELRPIIEHHSFDYDSFVGRMKREMQNDRSYAEASHLRSLVESSRQSNEPVFDAITKILSMNIVILEVNGKADYLFVSDNPGYSLLGNKMFNTNYGAFDKIVWPINSKQIILLDGFNPLNYINPLIRLRYLPVQSTYIQEVNKMTFLLADEKVFCENRDALNRFRCICNDVRNDQQELIAAYRGTSPPDQ